MPAKGRLPEPPPPATISIEEIADQLEHVGYIVLANPLVEELADLLFERCQDSDGLRFQSAQVGRGSGKRQDHALRGDAISWLEDADSTDHTYLAWMESLRSGLNSALYLGLLDFECHYAIYGAGSGYARHFDVLQGKRNRILSTVFYLNKGWQPSDGGELVLFAPTGGTVIARVNPTFGTMIIFLSESFPHAVRMAHTKRRSIAGWFSGRGMT